MSDGWEQSLLALLDDLEQQASGLHLVERDLEVEDRGRAEYARVALPSRVHGAIGRHVRITLLGGLTLAGVVERTGSDWLLLTDAQGQDWVLPHRAIGVLRGVTTRAVADDAVGVLARLPLRAVLRRLAEADADCVLHLVDGSRAAGRLIRLGADFAEVRLDGAAERGAYDVVPLSALAAVQPRS